MQIEDNWKLSGLIDMSASPVIYYLIRHFGNISVEAENGKTKNETTAPGNSS